MRKYLMIGMMLLSSAAIFIALHEYVEVTLLTTAQAQVTDAPAAMPEQTEAGECAEDCYKHSERVDLLDNTNPQPSVEQRVASILKKSTNKGDKKGNK